MGLLYCRLVRSGPQCICGSALKTDFAAIFCVSILILYASIIVEFTVQLDAFVELRDKTCFAAIIISDF